MKMFSRRAGSNERPAHEETSAMGQIAPYGGLRNLLGSSAQATIVGRFLDQLQSDNSLSKNSLNPKQQKPLSTSKNTRQTIAG